MSPINNLITDRTEPGPYDWRDFNRVETFVAEVAEILRKAGYLKDVVTKTDWIRQDIQTRQQMARYIANIQTMRHVLAFPPETPPAPDTMRFLTFQRANDIERILLDLEIQLESLMQVYPKSGTSWLYAGNTMYFPEIGSMPDYFLCDTVTGQRYGLIIEDGILKLQSVSSRFTPTHIRLLDTATGEVWELGVESGILYGLSIKVPANFQPTAVSIVDAVTRKTYMLRVASGVFTIVEV